jgi:hypothetical protein
MVCAHQKGARGSDITQFLIKHASLLNSSKHGFGLRYYSTFVITFFDGIMDERVYYVHTKNVRVAQIWGITQLLYAHFFEWLRVLHLHNSCMENANCFALWKPNNVAKDLQSDYSTFVWEAQFFYLRKLIFLVVHTKKRVSALVYWFSSVCWYGMHFIYIYTHIHTQLHTHTHTFTQTHTHTHTQTHTQTQTRIHREREREREKETDIHTQKHTPAHTHTHTHTHIHRTWHWAANATSWAHSQTGQSLPRYFRVLV